MLSLITIGCVGRTAVSYPVPIIPEGPEIHWMDARHDDEHPSDIICLSRDDTKFLLLYLNDLKTELRKARITVEEINR